MAFQTKYRVTFKDSANATWLIYFQLDPWAGAITELTGGDVPVTVNYLADSKYDPIVPRSLDIRLENSSIVEDMFTEEDRVIKVKLFSSVTHFIGYLTPNQYFRQLSGNTHLITLTTTDQINRLRDIKYEDSSDDPYFYLTDDLTALSEIILKTGAWETMKEDINIYEDDMNNAVTDTPLDQVYFYPEKYWDSVTDERSDSYIVLENILKKYGARIFFDENIWWIQRINAVWAKRTIRQYSAGASWTYLSNESAYKLFNVDDESADWAAYAEIIKKARAGRVEITANPGRRTNLVKNSTFDEFTYTGAFPASSFPRYWVSNGASRANDSDGYITINDSDSASDPTDSIYIDFYTKGVIGGNIVIDLEAHYANGTNCTLHFAISNISETLWFWPQGFPGDYPIWQGAEKHYEFDVVAESANDSRLILTIPVNGLGRIVNEYGNRIHIFEVWNNNDTDCTLKIYDIRFEPTYSDASPDTEIAAVDNALTSYNTIRGEIVHCDTFAGISGDQDGMFWINKDGTGLADTTSLWSIKGDPTASSSIQSLLARQYLEGNYTPVDVIHGTLIGDYRYYKGLVEDSIKDEKGFSKTFAPVRQSWNVARRMWTGDWEEVVAVYTDQSLDWASHSYVSATITANSIDIDANPVTGTQTAISDAYTTILGEMIRIVVTCTDDGSSDLPNYDYDGNTGTLAWGINYLEFRATAGSNTFQINHTTAETAVCTVSFKLYTMKGI